MKQNVFVWIIVLGCWTLNDVECTAFNLFVTQESRNLVIISFQQMFHKTLRYCLAKTRSLTFNIKLSIKIVNDKSMNLQLFIHSTLLGAPNLPQLTIGCKALVKR